MNHPLWRDFANAFVEGVKAYMPKRNERVEDATAWCCRFLIPTITANPRDAKVLKHAYERYHGATHIYVNEWIEAARAAGIRVEGYQVFARLHKDVRLV